MKNSTLPWLLTLAVLPSPHLACTSRTLLFTSNSTQHLPLSLHHGLELTVAGLATQGHGAEATRPTTGGTDRAWWLAGALLLFLALLTLLALLVAAPVLHAVFLAWQQQVEVLEDGHATRTVTGCFQLIAGTATTTGTARHAAAAEAARSRRWATGTALHDADRWRTTRRVEP